MAEAVKMVVIDGIRYRPEDAPRKEERAEQAEAPNKARTTKSTSKK